MAPTYVDPGELTRRVQSLRSEGSPEAQEEAARLEREAEHARAEQLRDKDELTVDEQNELDALEQGEKDVASASGRSDDDGPDATDGARELAEAEGVDLSTVEGTGAGGKITKADVEREV